MATDPNIRSAGGNGHGRRYGRGRWILGAIGLAGLVGAALQHRRPNAPTGARFAPFRVHRPMPPARKGYEKRDANAKWIWGIIGFLLVFGLAIHFILAGMLSSLLKTPTPSDRWRPIEPASAALVPAAFPRLQVSPPQDLRTFRAREEEELHGFGWVNRTSGVVRLPIEQAMELVLKEGLPTRAGSNAPQAGPSEYQLIQQRPEHREPEIQGEK